MQSNKDHAVYSELYSRNQVQDMNVKMTTTTPPPSFHDMYILVILLAHTWTQVHWLSQPVPSSVWIHPRLILLGVYNSTSKWFTTSLSELMYRNSMCHRDMGAKFQRNFGIFISGRKEFLEGKTYSQVLEEFWKERQTRNRQWTYIAHNGIVVTLLNVTTTIHWR